MNSATYTKQQYSDARLLYAAIRSNPPDKQAIVKVMANTYISGMNAQRMLDRQSASTDRPSA